MKLFPARSKLSLAQRPRTTQSRAATAAVFQGILASIAMLFALLLPLASAQALSTSAKQAIIIDVETGTILFEKASLEQMAPSSMTKIMTALLVFDHLEAGRISLDTKFKVSRKAWAKKGSKCSSKKQRLFRLNSF